MKRPSKLPPIELIEPTFDYDPNSGLLIKRKTGSSIGSNDRTTGCMKVRIGRLTTQVSRVCWLLYYREDPVDYIIEHINGNPRDNRIVNLRKVKWRL